jgi:uncharacterized protein (UPF0218 family)
MTVVYALTPEFREKFKQPFGLLLRGTFAQTVKQLKAIMSKEKPPKIISVGDTVSRNLHEHEINPQLSITDNKSLRRTVQPAAFQCKRVFRVKNPRGTITTEAIVAVQDALRSSDDTHIIVDGEEDLLTLIAVLYAPDDSVVVYGQPYEGVVVVKVTAEKRAEAKQFLDAMICAGKAK